MSAASDGPDSELLARLARLGVVVGANEAAPPAAPRPDVLPIERAVPGAVADGPFGACYVTDARYAGDHRHGLASLGAALQASPAALARLCGPHAPRDGDLSLSRVVFLDTETTGLSRGAGTYAFLIGAGRFVGRTFQVRQLFMRDPSEERAQLDAFAQWVADCDAVVTFNGRSFDVPVLVGRHAMHGLATEMADLPHLDLLPPARRLWRRRLESCSLQSLERSVLGLERQDDIPGWLIPERYATYQRTGDARGLVGVFHHNVLDILSLVGLALRLADAYEQPHAVLEHGRDWLGLARAFEAAGELERAIAAYEAAMARGLDPEETQEALLCLGLAAKRGGDWPRAVEVWTALATAARPPRLAPFEELAKYYEHRCAPADFGRALAWADRARQHVQAGTLRPRRGRARALADLERRIVRLRRRIEG